MSTRSIALFALLIVAGFRTDQAWEKTTKTELLSAFERSSAWFVNTKNYRLKISYSTYTDHTTQLVHDKQDGYVLRSGDLFKSSMMGIITIQDEEMRSTIDTLNQLIVLTQKSPLNEMP